jgi:hypothetical protein
MGEIPPNSTLDIDVELLSIKTSPLGYRCAGLVRLWSSRLRGSRCSLPVAAPLPWLASLCCVTSLLCPVSCRTKLVEG